MTAYLARRLLLLIPTLFGILLISFTIIQFAPGGPVQTMIARLKGTDVSATARIGGEADSAGTRLAAGGSAASLYRGAQGLDPQFIEQLEKQYGFDRPVYERFLRMAAAYTRFDFGESYFRHERVSHLMLEKLPVSLSLGLWSTLIIYLVSIPLGISKAVSHGTRFDVWTSGTIVIAYAVPGFLVAILLIVCFAGGSYLRWFPLGGLVSDNWSELSVPGKIIDYLWHLILPVSAYALGGFATLTLLTKNSFLEEISKLYVVTARAKGLSERRVLYGHVFRNAMLIVIAGMPTAFFEMFIAGSLLIETIFGLDGLGLLSYESIVNRDYPVVFGMLFVFSLVGLLINLFADMLYTVVDPRIDFETQGR
ncbi:MAG TPA: microcin C ABC transporter permease YejB [Steroidobacteraceae bacterium]|nr:microcin C ABC transporter permease YejB [Steroidobacteraceae bacterium]